MSSTVVSEAISPKDNMFRADDYKLDRYLSVGREAANLIARHSTSPERILDFGCGHGRVLRHIVARYPEAEVWACDVDAEAVQFCETTFGAGGVVSALEAGPVSLPRVDLIWVGSVFTHLSLRPWRDFLNLLGTSLDRDGVLIFSLIGPTAVEEIRRGELEMGIGGEGAEKAFGDYDSTGFGWSAYLHAARPGHGLAFASPHRVRTELEAIDLDVVAYDERGWMNFQDVVVATANR